MRGYRNYGHPVQPSRAEAALRTLGAEWSAATPFGPEIYFVLLRQLKGAVELAAGNTVDPLAAIKISYQGPVTGPTQPIV